MTHLRRLFSWLRAIAIHFDPNAAYTQLAIKLTAFEQRHFEDQQQIIEMTLDNERLQALNATCQRELCRLRRENDAARAGVATLAAEVTDLKQGRDSALIALISLRAFQSSDERLSTPDLRLREWITFHQ